MEDSSASAVLSTLAPVALVAFVYFVAFLILRPRFQSYYSPRTFKGRTATTGPHVLPKGMFAWIGSLFKIPDSEVLRTNSVDAYLLLRLLKMGSILCIVGAVITWPVLLPVNITGGNGEKQFNMLNLGNVKNKWRFFAHAGCAWLFFGFIIYFITREMVFLINLRQAYFMSDRIKQRVSSRTVLFTSVPDEYMNEANLLEILGPANVERIWFPTQVHDLNEKWEERNKITARLEGAEVAVIRQAVLKQNNAAEGKKGAVGPLTDLEAGSPMIARWISPKDRPTHRSKPIIGAKHDTISFCRHELKRLTNDINEEREKHDAGQAERVRSVFVLFHSVPAAHDAYQCVTHHMVAMTPRYIGIAPGQVIWENLNIRGWERSIRRAASIGFAAALTIFWSIPVAFVASIANVDKLVELLPWLSFLNKLPTAIMGVVTGLLPVIAVSILVSLVPFFFRLAAKHGGAVSKTHIEITVNRMFFWFQVVQVFLVATLGSAAPAVVSSIINQPSSAAPLLAQNLPKSSTFYICWFILQGLGSVGGNLLSIVGLVLQGAFSRFLWNTPRKLFLGGMPRALQLGSVYPPYTLLILIAIGYACISPITLGFAAIALFLFWFVWRYNMLFTTGDSVDTHGMLYADTLKQLFVGLYIAEICLIGLFAIGSGSSRGALGPLILMIILLVITILYHINFNKTMAPLLNAMPRSLTMVDGVPPDVPTGKAPNPIVRFFKPHVHAHVSKLSGMMPRPTPGSLPTAEEVKHAYVPPCRRVDPFPIWLPDDTGVAARGIDHSQRPSDVNSGTDPSSTGWGPEAKAGYNAAGAPVGGLDDKERPIAPVDDEERAIMPSQSVPAGPSFARDEASHLVASGACNADQVIVSDVVVVKPNGRLELIPDRDEQMERAYSIAVPAETQW